MGFAHPSKARRIIEPNHVRIRYGPSVCFQMLSTYPFGYAVTFNYRGGQPPEKDFRLHRPCASEAHEGPALGHL